MLIATGADYNKLDVPECERFEGLGIYYAATQMELASCRGAEAVVVGGGKQLGGAGNRIPRAAHAACAGAAARGHMWDILCYHDCLVVALR
ncbi:MAG: hypothetical protein ACJ8CR_00350 [Roseiflexaceae bacterium]